MNDLDLDPAHNRLCMAEAASCVCHRIAGHGHQTGLPLDWAHRCCCGGEWIGEFGGDNFDIIQLPPGQFVAPCKCEVSP